MAATTVQITYGNGDKKKSCVRMKAVAVEPATIDLTNIGDYYIPNAALEVLGNPKEVVVTLTVSGVAAKKTK